MHPRNGLVAAFGGLLAAFLGSLCCVGPLVFVALGFGAGLASRFEPLRPLFAGLMVLLFALGFASVYGRRSADAADVGMTGTSPHDGDPSCDPGTLCAVPRRRTRDVALLWTATALAALLWTFPTWSRLFP
ncbi:MAG: hypothetical protein HOQ17_01740 [Gemmatimonadaceae bacterium]|nr:hypothetical protein [Gemmatimonadaceae bacterium]NUP55325.1 hypothetical protein [Gemmatimonadaceae bacterium]NUP71387.1 hypothetical protein [Gemmatimonadaceae bacterium]NUR35227.1 hypothetical protein [Gemmatimonadaceae bacterium]NUS31753.1 hypothetical protein [Gemmatimonadaceae bacterium]